MKSLAATVFFIALLGLFTFGEASAQSLCVSASRANLRAGPGKEYRITWEVNQFMPLVQVGQKADWIKVRDVDGDIHWVFKPLISAKLNCITIKKPKAHIRSKPRSNAKRWFTVEKYTSFKKVGENKKWVQIQYKGKKLWIFKTLIWPN